MASTKEAKSYFTKVRIARELLKERAEELLNEYLDVVARAKDAGQYDVAAKSLQWLIDHMPADEDGGRLVDISVDKKQEAKQQGPTGPAIQIGIQVGGAGGSLAAVKKPNELPTATIDAEVVNE